MSLFNNQKTCISICTPMPKRQGSCGPVFDPISPVWHRARQGLHFPTNINLQEIFADGMEVGDARSKVAASLLRQEVSPEFHLWLDYDVLMPPDALTKLFFRARCYPDFDIFAGVYCCKHSNPPDPLIYAEHGQGSYWDWAVGDLLTTEQHGIKSVHMGLTLIRVSLFKRLLESGLVGGEGDDQDNNPFYKTLNFRDGNSLRAGTEDIYMCDLVAKLSPPGKILVDTSVLAGHEDKNTGVVYGLPYTDGPARRAKWLPDKDGKRPDESEQTDVVCSCVIPERPAELHWEYNKVAGSYAIRDCKGCGGSGKIRNKLSLALDLGAGGERRSWPGHRTYTTDIRKETKPDYVQDTRMLNLPNDHYDLVASSHHLEHLPRWEQDLVWKEIYRVCKPGGRIEHVVPSLDWAGAKIVAGEVDEHVVNVLYGAQEAHGYARIFNLHYFGYTRNIAKALAESAGFVDVECEDWRIKPEHGYNLVVRGRKPDSPSTIEATITVKDVTS